MQREGKGEFKDPRTKLHVRSRASLSLDLSPLSTRALSKARGRGANGINDRRKEKAGTRVKDLVQDKGGGQDAGRAPR